MIRYKITPICVSNTEAFTEASKEELRVLLALIERNGAFDDNDALAAAAHTSRARAAAALVLWEEAGVISPLPSSPTITEEFEERLHRGEISEVSAEDTAKAIRQSSLADMISECSFLMKRSALSTAEIKNLTALHEQYALSSEFIVTLAAYLAEEGKLTVTRLINRAIQLTEREIDNVEALSEYISTSESESAAEREFRKIFGIYGRAPSKSEKDYFIKWSRDFGYSSDIVGEAYDIAVSAVTRGHAKYADKLLSRWHESGCKSLTECRERYEADLAEKKAAAEAKPKASRQKEKKPTERYGSFDVTEAFMAALERSYPSDAGEADGAKK